MNISPVSHFFIGLMLRSAAAARVSKHEAAPSFETGPSCAPQDEAEKGRPA